MQEASNKDSKYVLCSCLNFLILFYGLYVEHTHKVWPDQTMSVTSQLKSI